MILTSVNVGIQAISKPEDCAMAASMYEFLRSLGMPWLVPCSRTQFQATSRPSGFPVLPRTNQSKQHGGQPEEDHYPRVLRKRPRVRLQHDDRYRYECIGGQLRDKEIQYGQDIIDAVHCAIVHHYFDDRWVFWILLVCSEHFRICNSIPNGCKAYLSEPVDEFRSVVIVRL